MIEKKHRALASIYLINDAVASNLAMLAAWYLRFHTDLIPVTKGMQNIEQYISILPIITVVFPLAFAIQDLYRIRPARTKAEEWMSVAIGSVVATVVLSGVLLWIRPPKRPDVLYSRATLGIFMLCAILFVIGGRMLVRTDMKTGKSYILTGLFEGKPYNALNDISIDEKGRIYFTDPRYLGHEPVMADGFAAYRVDPDGSVQRVATDCGKCNGILVSPDQKRVYIVSNDNGWLAFENLKEGEKTLQGSHLLQVYDLSPAGTLSNRRVFKDYSKDRTPGCSGPDGLVADADGNLWVVERCEHRPGVTVYAPDGRELAHISTGKELPTNVGFGWGADANVLYLTSGKSVYRITVAKKGYQLP